MPVKGGTKCLKYLLFGFNVIFWLAGIASLAIGLWFRFDPEIMKILNSESETSTFSTDKELGRQTVYRIWIEIHILIAAGAIMIVVGFLGCCGAIRESQCMLGLYFTFLLVIFALEVTATMLGFAMKEKVSQETKNIYNSLLEKRRDPNERAYLKAFHMGFNCCGPYGIRHPDYQDTCPENPVACPKAIDDYHKYNMNLTGAIGIGVAVMMIFGLMFSLILCCTIRRDREMV